MSEFTDGGQLYRAVAGDAGSFNIAVGEHLPAQATFDQLMLAGEIPNVIRDVSTNARVAGLSVTRAARIGAYVGVPLLCPDGNLYGTISAASHSPVHTLDEGAARLLSLLGELIIHDVGEQRARGELRAAMLGLIESGEFGLAYQPLFDLSDGRCLGVEAVARFPEPFLTLDQALAAAVQVGLGIELERAAALAACEIIPQLAGGQFLAVNASPAALLRLARRSDAGAVFPLARVVVELSEHSVIHTYAALRDQLVALREQGLRIAVDDVGAGYASVRHILELRPDFIKLDRWLIDGLADDRSRRVAVSAFVSLARELGSRVVAQGVKRPADLSVVRDLGLDGAQGDLLGGPSGDWFAVAAWGALGDGRRRGWALTGIARRSVAIFVSCPRTWAPSRRAGASRSFPSPIAPAWSRRATPQRPAPRRRPIETRSDGSSSAGSLIVECPIGSRRSGSWPPGSRTRSTPRFSSSVIRSPSCERPSTNCSR